MGGGGGKRKGRRAIQKLSHCSRLHQFSAVKPIGHFTVSVSKKLSEFLNGSEQKSFQFLLFILFKRCANYGQQYYLLKNYLHYPSLVDNDKRIREYSVISGELQVKKAIPGVVAFGGFCAVLKSTANNLATASRTS